MTLTVTPETEHSGRTVSGKWILRIVLLVIYVALAARLSWLADDALITLRTALNLTHGWGAGFNAGEAVQAYTHPLWFLTWMGLGQLTGEWLLTVLILGLVLSAIAVGLALWVSPTSPAIALTFAIVILSSAFMDYSTSGLENPLGYLTVGVLFVVLFRSHESLRRSGLIIGVLVGLTTAAAILTRLDLALLVLPVFAWYLWQVRSRARTLLVTLVAFGAPLLVWAAWAYITYGSILPNTFVAKTNLAIPRTELVAQGIRYIVLSVERDWVTGIALLAGLLIGLLRGTSLSRTWSVGILLYLGYTAWVGGDFMAGRFLAVPMYVAVLIIASSSLWRGAADQDPRQTSTREVIGTVAVLGGVALFIAASQVIGVKPSAIGGPTTIRFEGIAGVGDERGIWTTQLRNGWYWYLRMGTSPPIERFRTLAEVADEDGNLEGLSELVSTNSRIQPLREYVAMWPEYNGETLPREVGVSCGSLATGGLLTGPTVHWVDTCALTDAYLAEQPYWSPPFRWQPGHFLRRVPEGYQFAILTGDPGLMADPGDAEALRKVWERIRK